MSAPRRLDIILNRVSVIRGQTWALRDLSLSLRGGERWALLGANGSGKTQFLKLLATDVWPTPEGGEVRYCSGSRELTRVEAKPLLAYLGAEAQDKYSRHDWNLRVDELIATGLQGTDLLLAPVTRAQARSVAAMLSACGMEALRERRFLSLSYGQKRLALLARALVRRPAWLLLDELYNGLDKRYRRRIDALLAVARRRGQSWVIAAHRSGDVPAGTTRSVELERGSVTATGFLRRGVPASLGQPPVRLPCPAPMPVPVRGLRAGTVLVTLGNVDLYVDYRAVLRGVDWQLRAGESWAVLGANGAGKSSFLKLLYGDLHPAEGGLILRHGMPRGTPIENWKRRVGLVSPELQTDYLIDVSLLELVASGPLASIGLVVPATALQLRRARHWLEFFELSDQATLRPRELSYGQLRRALLARALAANPQLLLLDEPLTGLDPLQRRLIRQLLERLIASRVTLVCAVHHADDLPRGVARTLRLGARRAQPDTEALRRRA